MSLRLTPNAHKKNRLVIRTNGKRKRRSVTGTLWPRLPAASASLVIASPSSQRPVQVSVTTVHKYVLSGDVAGSLRKQKHNHVCDLFRLGHPQPERNLRDNCRQFFLGIREYGEPLLVERSHHFRRHHGVYANSQR